MRFRTVILISIWSVVAGALIVGYVMVNIAMRDHVRTRTAAELATHRTTLRALVSIQLEELGKTCELFAETPRLKAVAELADRNTVAQLMSELGPAIALDVLALSDRGGWQLFGTLSGSAHAFGRGLLARESPANPRDVVTGISVIDSGVYRLASAPVTVGEDVVGRLLVGTRITGGYLGALKETIGSDLLLAVDGRPAGATLDGDHLAGVAHWLASADPLGAGAGPAASSAPASNGPSSVPAGNEIYLATAMDPPRYDTGPSPRSIRLLLLKPVVSETEAALAPVIRSFILLSAGVLLVTIGVGIVVSRGVTRPIAGLVRGTAEISRGNYDHEIAIPKGVELKFLATKFGEMSASLKEKVHELGERNLALELALRKLRETQEELIRTERLAATGKLTAQLSHEINNPVHNILSSLQTALKKTPADAPSRELLELAHDEVERLARLTRQLLTAYRESISSPDPREVVDINRVVRDVTASSAEMLRLAGVALDLALAEPLPPVAGSGDKLKQLFLNLVVNARDAMPRGGRLSISTASGPGLVTAVVSDTGVGIPPEHINRIFDAFFTTKGKVSGTGLGLSVSYGIVQQHRGTIRVASSPGNGASFTVTFPTDTGTSTEHAA